MKKKLSNGFNETRKEIMHFYSMRMNKICAIEHFDTYTHTYTDTYVN